ncbi:TetR/AcrR family transcriptional regulator [Streptomyces sp. NBC_01142]|uniref:TetR/AcrR family transcriptional regulator n=1 Tax=Streptomyces sp. NBC_01142 TaxID=2975865 RepID=UPI0022593112|nr:TetR/AcrR family transcriptional regulator [Streptomyces sp. NBC_01142]MCX4820407.1 TetR/AcrR family transcriptional regulator [Streptomyces sp. NBC_01142]
MPPPAGRGRPRSEEAAARILEAAYALLLDRGYDRFSVGDVSERAGVAKTTLYRRWPTKDHLIVALVARMQDAVAAEYTGDVHSDLVRYFGQVNDGLDRMRLAGRPAGANDRSAGLVAEIAAAAARHADVGDAVHALHARRNAAVVALLDQAKERGEVRADTDAQTVVDQLAGALYYRVLATGLPRDAGYVDRLVSSVLTGVRPVNEGPDARL